MGSPSATAAYLMHSSVWSTKAEMYLQTVVWEGSGKSSGGVPSVYPTSYTEVAWRATSSAEILELPEVTEIRTFLQSLYDSNHGIIGFDSGILKDSDDSAKLLLSLALLGSPQSPERLVQEFESAESFRSYHQETSGSLSANCNVLDALLHAPSPAAYSSQIVKLCRFICHGFQVGQIEDKWHLSENYSRALAAGALSSCSNSGETTG
ncbi:Ent-kaurene synthase [Apiospora marii]|uniref:Ent-kaurene synthase n=1 Tax=Apiospora marii TaxID=335849 RepID=A0ABR1RG50_9PEZI